MKEPTSRPRSPGDGAKSTWNRPGFWFRSTFRSSNRRDVPICRHWYFFHETISGSLWSDGSVHLPRRVWKPQRRVPSLLEVIDDFMSSQKPHQRVILYRLYRITLTFVIFWSKITRLRLLSHAVSGTLNYGEGWSESKYYRSILGPAQCSWYF